MPASFHKVALVPLTVVYSVSANGGVHKACDWLFGAEVPQCQERPDLPAHGEHPAQLPSLLATGTSTGDGGGAGPMPRFITGAAQDDAYYQTPPSVLFRPATTQLGSPHALMATLWEASRDEFVPSA
jgi:hypothetical protein